MNKNDMALKKTALYVGISLLIFSLLFYTLFAVLNFIISPLVYALLSAKLGYVVTEVLTGIIYTAVFIIPALIFRKISHNQSAEHKIAPKFPLDLAPFIIMATVAISISCAYVNSWLGIMFGVSDAAAPTTEVSSLLDFLLLVFTTALVPAICEEFLFRKTIEHALLPYGEGFAIISSAVLFGLMHQNAWQIFYATMAGILLGYVYAKTRSYLCVFLIHLVNNFISSIQTAISANTKEPYASIAISMLVVIVLILGVTSAIILVLKEKNKKDIYETGSFGKLFGPSSSFIKSKTASPSKTFFLSPTVLIFIILSVLVCAYQFL